MEKLPEILKLGEEYSACTRCPSLCADRKAIINGSGNLSASVMVIVDSPSLDDERAGAFLVNKDVAELIHDAFSMADTRWGDVYVTGMVSCRPFTYETGRRGEYTRNRNPTKAEFDNCRERLMREIYIVDPKVIVLLGDAPAKLATTAKLTSIVGDLFYVKVPGRLEGVELKYPAIPTWNPVLAVKDSGTASRDAIAKHIKLAVDLSRTTRAAFESRTTEIV